MAKRDLITKDFALYVVHYFNAMQTWNKEDILSEIDRTIKEAKPEDAVPVVHGRWIEQTDLMMDTYYDCSACGESFCLIDGEPTDNLYNYCPNCGSRMDGEENAVDQHRPL